MKRYLAATLIVLVTVMVAAPPSFAHHSRAQFDMTRNVTYQGTVKEYRWENPHSHLVITVAAGGADPATVGTWDVEASSVSLMRHQGWSPTTFKPGDPITVVAHPSRSGAHSILLFYALATDSTRLYRAQHRYPSEVE